MKIGIVGCGTIGRKRAVSVLNCNDMLDKCDRKKKGHKIVGLCDIDLTRAKLLADEFSVDFVTDDYHKLLERQEMDLLIVSTLNHMLAPIARSAAEHGIHVIVEKPGAISSKSLKQVMDVAKRKQVLVKVGFNHRYHPAMIKAKEIMNSGVAGNIMFIRGRYGHGGRVGYDREWRADAALSGGGETIDQGVHLIDLARWYMGDFDEVTGFAETYFWDMPVDDNGFIGLRKKDGRAAWLQVSCTEWKNMFSFEIYCKHAKLAMEGLGGSYGTERLYHYQMGPQMGPPDTVIYEYPKGDRSWDMELYDVIQAIEEGKSVAAGDICDAYAALKIVEQIYDKGENK